MPRTSTADACEENRDAVCIKGQPACDHAEQAFARYGSAFRICPSPSGAAGRTDAQDHLASSQCPFTARSTEPGAKERRSMLRDSEEPNGTDIPQQANRRRTRGPHAGAIRDSAGEAPRAAAGKARATAHGASSPARPCSLASRGGPLSRPACTFRVPSGSSSHRRARP